MWEWLELLAEVVAASKPKPPKPPKPKDMGAQGTADLDFGAFPGSPDASVVITGQAGIISGSLVEVWLRPVATADHTADEQMLEPLALVAGNIVGGTGFTIYGFCTNQLREPADVAPKDGQPGRVLIPDSQVYDRVGKNVSCLYGVFKVAWVWN